MRKLFALMLVIIIALFFTSVPVTCPEVPPTPVPLDIKPAEVSVTATCNPVTYIYGGMNTWFSVDRAYAKPGETVTATVYFENAWSVFWTCPYFAFCATGQPECWYRPSLSSPCTWLKPGYAISYDVTFTMPNYDVVIDCYEYIYTYDPNTETVYDPGAWTYVGQLKVCLSAEFHDVAITSVTRSTSCAVGQTINISVTVRNNGTYTETFSVSSYYDSTLIGTQTVTSLAAGASKDLVFKWNTTGVAAGTYTIKAVASTVSGETNTGNNQKIDGTVTISTGGGFEYFGARWPTPSATYAFSPTFYLSKTAVDLAKDPWNNASSKFRFSRNDASQNKWDVRSDVSFGPKGFNHAFVERTTSSPGILESCTTWFNSLVNFTTKPYFDDFNDGDDIGWTTCGYTSPTPCPNTMCTKCWIYPGGGSTNNPTPQKMMGWRDKTCSSIWDAAGTWSNLSLEFDMFILTYNTSRTNRMGVFWRYKDGNNHYGFFFYRNFTGKYINLHRMRLGDDTELYNWETGKWYRVLVLHKGDRITVYVNRELWFDSISSKNTYWPEGGKIILYSSSAHTHFDNVGVGYDVQQIATHEFGHWLALNDLHLIYGHPLSWSNNTMWAINVSAGETKKRTLEWGDKNGIKFIYGCPP